MIIIINTDTYDNELLRSNDTLVFDFFEVPRSHELRISEAIKVNKWRTKVVCSLISWNYYHRDGKWIFQQLFRYAITTSTS